MAALAPPVKPKAINAKGLSKDESAFWSDLRDLPNAVGLTVDNLPVLASEFCFVFEAMITP